MPSTSAPATGAFLDQPYLSLEDAASFADKSERTIRRWTEAGRRDRGVLPALRSVHGVHIRTSDLVSYLRPVPVRPDDADSAERGCNDPHVATRRCSECRELAVFDELSDVIARVVSTAPPLTDEQRQRLAVILSGGAR